jgi:hypothetical protein
MGYGSQEKEKLRVVLRSLPSETGRMAFLSTKMMVAVRERQKFNVE